MLFYFATNEHGPHLDVARADAELCHVPKRSRRANQLAVAGFEVLAFFALLLRLFSRWRLTEKYGVDDWIMVAVAVMDVAFVVIGNYAGMLGFGVDTWYVAPDDLTFALKVSASLPHNKLLSTREVNRLTGSALLHRRNPVPRPPRPHQSFDPLFLLAHLSQPRLSHALRDGHVLGASCDNNVHHPPDLPM